MQHFHLELCLLYVDVFALRRCGSSVFGCPACPGMEEHLGATPGTNFSEANLGLQRLYGPM